MNNGQNADGTWSLCVTDDACGDNGGINYWELNFGNNPAPPGSGGCSSPYVMGNCSSDSTCTGDFFDSGNNSGDYSSSELIVETYCSDAGNCIQVDFSAFETESCCDELNIYDGNSTSGTLIGSYAGSSLPNGGTIQSSSGCLTFEFDSDGSITDPGWEASFSCNTCPTCSDGIQNGSETGVDCGGSDCPSCPCEDQVIASLPYSQTNMSTCGEGDDYSSSDACGSSYMNGDDYVFEYTSPGNECITVDLSNTDSYTGVFLLDGCPDDPATTCIAEDTESGGNPTLGTTISSAGTYYIAVSTFPGPQCTDFDIDVTTTATGQPGTDCGTPYSIGSLPFNQTGLSTQCYGDEYGSTDACGSSYMNGDDYVFEYTPSANGSINITLSNTDSYAGVFLLDGCPDAGGTTCVDYDTQSGGNPSVSCVNVTGGQTYYIVVSTYPSPQSTPFDITVENGTPTPSCGLNYASQTITHAPYNYSTGTNVNIVNDDEFADSWSDIGFTFCFDGVGYDQVLISSNGYLAFPGCHTNVPGGSATPSGGSPYDIDADIPNTTDAPTNAIMGPWHDIDPSEGGVIRHELYGTSPNRVFVVKYSDIPMFSSSCNGDASLNFSGQIMLYEGTNDIEVHLDNKQICSSWPSDVAGTAIMGLHSYDGSTAVVPAGGYNYSTNWTASNEAWRFSPNCGSCTVLPIELLSFTGEAKSKGNLLEWATASELNNDHFLLQRSSNGKDFKTVSKVKGAGNSTEKRSYSFLDRNAPTSRMYYRLIQVDRDGTETVSSIILVNRSPVSKISLQPNPSKGAVNLTVVSQESYEYQIVISDVIGNGFRQKVRISKGTNSIKLHKFEGLAPGLYMVRILDRNGELIRSEKVIKE